MIDVVINWEPHKSEIKRHVSGNRHALNDYLQIRDERQISSEIDLYMVNVECMFVEVQPIRFVIHDNSFITEFSAKGGLGIHKMVWVRE